MATIELDINDENLDFLVCTRLDECADTMENLLGQYYTHEDYKEYLALIKASNYFKVHDEQRKPLKFTKKTRNHR